MFVIFGATGKAGHMTATTLRHAGLPVRAVVRNLEQAVSLKQSGCEVVQADLTNAAAVAHAIAGAYAVQILCPVVPADDPHASDTMRQMIQTAADALRRTPPAVVLGLSDFGAELPQGTGITMLFHELEHQLKTIPTRLTLLRSAEHLQNWARVLPIALATNTLPSLHAPLDHPFATVSAHDVGLAAAQLLQQEPANDQPHIVSIEGPRRVSVEDIAQTLSELAGRPIKPYAVPRANWPAMLARGGHSADYIRLMSDLYDTHNAGGIDVETGAGEHWHGQTTLRMVLGALLARATVPAP
ncbi:uncharacterized protein YbjT (DUF2867 family) [Silvimonas terrae]|uniref:Uncharacterized protein YbjT (DUF2867 family) n=1 Tax=Silvimonas terrae TaxID=300266 RepID=A0A840RAQ9_9NEIS|nr:NmrA family NAD(P)-binding protein [Silvimonas terrae]MBB5189391.1 uncharacterized protein YbjT (DUF2867 family) [Silvimonas terrae]